jgi:hypothetical protein
MEVKERPHVKRRGLLKNDNPSGDFFLRAWMRR